jgi:PAS domain S-box-containing protein
MIKGGNTGGNSLRVSRRITFTYALFASLWILLSGYFLIINVADPALQWRLEMAKGLGFVAVSSVLLYVLLSRWMPFSDWEMFDANPHPMWVYDTQNLRFLVVNDAAVEHYGYSREQFLAMTLLDIRPQDDIARLKQHIATQPLEGIDKAGHWRHRKADGSVIDVEISSHPLRFNGVPAELVLAYDITGRLQAAARLRASEQFATAIIDALALNIAVLDATGSIIATNQAWRDFTQANEGDESRTGIGVNYLEVTRRAAASGSEDAATLLTGLEAVMAGSKESFSFEYPCHSPAEQSWYLVLVTRFAGAGEARLVVAHENVSRRKIAEQELQKLNRYYAALSHMNNLLIRSQTPEEMIAGICRIAVEQGELALVWVGQLDERTHTLMPVASAGAATGYLDDILISADPAIPEGQGPAGIAVRTGQVSVFNHFANDSRSGPWQQAASTWQLEAAAVCPIRRQGGIWGVIGFHANETDYFNAQLVALLEELTADLAFSLDALENNRKHDEAQAQLLLNARVIESSHEGMFITDSNNRITMANRAMCDIIGYSAEELLGQWPSLLKSERHDEAFYQNLWQ